MVAYRIIILRFFHEDLATSLPCRASLGRYFLSLKGRCFIHICIYIYYNVFIFTQREYTSTQIYEEKMGDIYINKVILFYSYILL